jgi:hypothetical protein
VQELCGWSRQWVEQCPGKDDRKGYGGCRNMYLRPCGLKKDVGVFSQGSRNHCIIEI